MKYWLMKTEPDVFSIDDLKSKKEAPWDGVRNYQARNFMTNEMAVGDQVLFYHSSCEPPGVAGLASVSRAAAPDLTALDKKSESFDAKATKENPIWFCVSVRFQEKFPRLVSLDEIRQRKTIEHDALAEAGSTSIHSTRAKKRIRSHLSDGTRMKPFVSIAPMEGVVDWILRDLLTRMGGIDRAVTEFVRVTDQVLPPHVFLRYCPELKTRRQNGVGRSSLRSTARR